MNWYQDKIKNYPAYSSLNIVSTPYILYPPFGLLMLKLFVLARQEGLKVKIFETYRSQERQVDLFNKGATQLRTNGMHHFGIATDIVFLNNQNSPSWDQGHNWARLGQLGRSLGLEWGGSWTSFIDRPHFQLVPATTSAQAQIINGNYPACDSAKEQLFNQAVILYSKAMTEGFSSISLANLLACLSPQFFTRPSPFFRDLEMGMTGPDVRFLQKFLNKDPETRIALSGIGSLGQESDYFGNLTKLAVQKFQIKYVVHNSTDVGYGKLDAKTRGKIDGLAMS